MTKQTWLNHISEVTGLNPNDDGIKEAVRYHGVMIPDCPECKARKATRKRNFAARAKHEAYTSCGMKRVRGSLGGIYYE
jgi:hypothetical protein